MSQLVSQVAKSPLGHNGMSRDMGIARTFVLGFGLLFWASGWSAAERVALGGVDLTTAALPEGWRHRLVTVQNANTAAPSDHPPLISWCLDKEDLCVAQRCAFHPKDQNFVQALNQNQLVDPTAIADRPGTVNAR